MANPGVAIGSTCALVLFAVAGCGRGDALGDAPAPDAAVVAAAPDAAGEDTAAAGDPDAPGDTVTTTAPDAAPTSDDGGSAARDAGNEAAASGNFGLDERPANPHCVAPSRPGPATVPRTLAETGCFDAQDARKPAAGLIPFTINSPLWADGAEKERWMAIPDGARITIREDGDWTLPVGSVLVKTFRLAGKRVETRLLVRHADGGWEGYSYEWNEAETEAVWLGGVAKRKAVGDVSWSYPARFDCTRCHTQPAGHTLGLETGQLNGDFTYPNGRRANQVATLAHIGLFDAPLAAPADQLPAYPDPADARAALAARARSYLHSNCSACHRPGAFGGRGVTLDLRYATPLAEASACNIGAHLGVGDYNRRLLIAPGHPEQSVVTYRIGDLGRSRMPPLGSARVDQAGLKVVSDWIQSLAECPKPAP